MCGSVTSGLCVSVTVVGVCLVCHRETQPNQDMPLDLVGANENVANTVDIETSDQSTNITALSSATNASSSRCSKCVCVWGGGGGGG